MNRRVRMTLGELIATVTDEVEQSSGRNATTNMVVSQILNRLFNEGKFDFPGAPLQHFPRRRIV
jgi:hypothetical protein